MDETPPLPVTSDPAAIAAYVASISGELAQLARANGLSTLAYILDMARLEARNAALLDAEKKQKKMAE